MANVRLTEHGTMTPQAKDAVATDAPAGLQEASRSAAHVVIRGDFRLVLWDWSIAGNTAEGPFDLTTGQWDRRLAGPDVSGLHIAEEGGQRQAYLDVTNGTFEARWTQGQRVTLWQSLQSLHANGAAQLLGVVAANGIDVPGDADRLTFTGQVDLTVLAADASHARVGVAGDWAATDGGGRTLAVAAVPLNVPWTPIILGVLASAAVAAVVRRRINSVRFEELRADIELHEYPAALRRARQLRRVGRLRADVRLLHCIALLRMQDIEGAARILGERDEWPGPTATWSYLAATLAVARNRTEAALGHLRESIQQAPELVVEIESNPLLAPLLGRALGSHDPVGYV